MFKFNALVNLDLKESKSIDLGVSTALDPSYPSFL